MVERLHSLDDYDYHLPAENIAQFPVSPRDASRLLFISREQRCWKDASFLDLPEMLQQGDTLVLNNTRVLPARLQSNRGEVLLVKPVGENLWDGLVRPGKNFKPGTIVEFTSGYRATILSHSPIGRILQFDSDVFALLNRQGSMPLPPYIERPATEKDKTDYQTVYARVAGSVAAPTAGLHFTRRVFRKLKERGIQIARLTLHVGPGTFRPVKTEDITRHKIYPEYYRVKPEAWDMIRTARRVIAAGTTTTRALETIAESGKLEGYADLFIYPGYRFRLIQGLLTNFHLPKSSLLMLVSAFGGYNLVRKAYNHAVDSGYRFYSYGDAMLIL